MQYHELIPMSLNEVQHQQRELGALKAQNARLQAAVIQQQRQDEEQRVQNATLAARLGRLEAAAGAATWAGPLRGVGRCAGFRVSCMRH